jgi:hypothetical protein
MRADGFVIALAQWQGLTVVTAENRRGPDKIPTSATPRALSASPSQT